MCLQLCLYEYSYPTEYFKIKGSGCVGAEGSLETAREGRTHGASN